MTHSRGTPPLPQTADIAETDGTLWVADEHLSPWFCSTWLALTPRVQRVPSRTEVSRPFSRSTQITQKGALKRGHINYVDLGKKHAHRHLGKQLFDAFVARTPCKELRGARAESGERHVMTRAALGKPKAAMTRFTCDDRGLGWRNSRPAPVSQNQGVGLWKLAREELGI